MDYIKTGFLTSLPIVVALAGVLISGVLSDYPLKRGVSIATSRKLPIIAGLLLLMSMIGAIFTDSTALVITFMSIAFFGNGLASITWSLVSALAPSNLIGLTDGMFNFIGNLSSIAIPVGNGLLVSATDSRPAFIYMTVIAAVGFLSYVFLVGKVQLAESYANKEGTYTTNSPQLLGVS